MSIKVYTASSQEVLTLALAPFAKGGEGSLYKIRSPKKYENYAAKIYHKNKRDAQRQEKINYLIEHPPKFEHPSQAKSIVWPIDQLQQNGRFVGYLMPLAKGEKLETLCTPKLPKKLGAAWKRLAFEQAEAMELRIKICFNLAVALYHIHATGHYVLVDLKADNILIRPNGLISIVDMDSIEVVDGNQVLFPAPMATPEFTPAEFYQEKGLRKGPILETWDRFAMAVIFYKVLFGIHPFAGSSKAPFEKYVTLADKIEHGLFIQAPEKQQYFSVVPAPHQVFLALPEGLKMLFLQCFVRGHQNPVWRPSAEDWCIALSDGTEVGLVSHRPLLSHLLEFQKVDIVPLDIAVPQWTQDNIYDFVLDRLSGKQRTDISIFFELNPITSNEFTSSYKKISSILIPLTIFAWIVSYSLEENTGKSNIVLFIITICLTIATVILLSMDDWYNPHESYREKSAKFWKENKDTVLSKVSTNNKIKIDFFEDEDLHRFMYNLSLLEEQYKKIKHSTSNIQYSKQTNLPTYQQEQDKKIIQLSKAERKALQELKEALENDSTWQKFKGQNLTSKLHNVETYYNQYHIAKLEEELQKKYQQIDAQFNQLAAEQSKAYHQQLKAIDLDAKKEEKQLATEYNQQLATLGSDAPVYKTVQKNLDSVQENFKKELNALHSALTKDINSLEQQQHKNLQNLKEQTEQQLNKALPEAKKDLLAQAEQQATTLIHMTHQNISELKKVYQQRQEKLSVQWINQEQQLDEELLAILKAFIQQNREEKALKLQVEQVQHQKRKNKILAELKFIYQRQQTIDNLQGTKQKATQEYNLALANMQQEIMEIKTTLVQLHNYYSADITAIKAKYDLQYQTILDEAKQQLLEQQLQLESQQQAIQKELEQTKIALEENILSKLDINLSEFE